jgi:hypothetical protein
MSGDPYFVAQTREIAFSHPGWRTVVMDLTESRPRLMKALSMARALPRVDAWYQCGGHLLLHHQLGFRYALRLGIPIVLHWIGTDVLKAPPSLASGGGLLKLARRMTHWVTAPWLAEELSRIGIDADFVPFTGQKRKAYLASVPPRLPSRFTVVTGIPEERPNFYHWPDISRLAAEFPEIEVLVVRAEGGFAAGCPPNVRFLGWVQNMYDVYARSTVAVRMTRHDGYTGSVQEPLILGRHVVWTYPFPGALLARDYDDLRGHIRRLIELHDNGRLEINLEGRDYIRRNLDPDQLAAGMRNKLAACLEAS